MGEELDNARRTITKAEEALEACAEFFASQAQMNAQAHMSNKVLYPPIHSVIVSTLNGIQTFKETYPE